VVRLVRAVLGLSVLGLSVLGLWSAMVVLF
jgi:hypothetical protein